MPAGATIELPPRYESPRHLANGGMAAVYAARDAVLGRQVAIKVLAAHVAEDPAAVRRFQREARAAARVSQHPHVVTIYDVGEHDGRPFIVMELMEGGSLAHVLREGPPARGEALRWVAETAAALDAAHELDVIHRDVKPGNLLLDDRRRLGVADFGIARLAYESSVTLTGQVLGTAAYVAPEQAAGEGATAASDRYALAVVAYELLTGKRPYRGGTLAAQARQHVEAEPAPASSHDPDLPAAVDGVLRRGLAKDPGARWPSSGELAEALAVAAGEDATEVTQPLTAPTRPAAAAAAAGNGAAGEAAAKTPVPDRAGLDRGARDRPVPDRAASGRMAQGPVPDRAASGRMAPGPVPAGPLSRRRVSARRWLPVALVGLLVLLVGVIALASGGGDEPRTASGPDRTAQERPRSQPREEPAAAAPASGSEGESAAALNDRGFALMNQGRYDEAIPPLQQAVERCGDSRETVCAYALYNLGRSLRLAGRPDEAIPILERRLTYDNQTEVVQAELDAARRDAGQDDSATSSAPPGADHSREENAGNGRGKGKDKDEDKDD